MAVIESVGHHLRQPRTDFGLFAVTNGLDQQLPQRPALELHLAQHIEDLAAQ